MKKSAEIVSPDGHKSQRNTPVAFAEDKETFRLNSVTPSKQNIRNQRKTSPKVSLESLLIFLFPPALQHPLSTGRLFAFGLYGPLDENSQLRSGHKGSHVVTNWELDTMCQRFEREIILQVYLGSDSFELLSETEVEAVIAQADRRTKVAKGKAGMQQITPEEVQELFSDLKTDAEGLLSFHEMQQRIVEYRLQRIEEFKVIFPELMGGSKKKGRNTRTLCGQGGQTGVVVKSTGTRRKGKISSRVAPPEMFQKNTGLTEMEISSNVNRLLSSNALHIVDFGQGGDSAELTQNVTLIRKNKPPDDGRSWDSNCCLRQTHVGGHAKTAKSSTTVKRLA
mmetsp:Transcript_367/g.465  ORF Transcript_367/g.465 Transcript_367/m.465 type:complete len:337 (+) Transcript_367:30-1040(+)